MSTNIGSNLDRLTRWKLSTENDSSAQQIFFRWLIQSFPSTSLFSLTYAEKRISTFLTITTPFTALYMYVYS